MRQPHFQAGWGWVQRLKKRTKPTVFSGHSGRWAKAGRCSAARRQATPRGLQNGPKNGTPSLPLAWEGLEALVRTCHLHTQRVYPTHYVDTDVTVLAGVKQA